MSGARGGGSTMQPQTPLSTPKGPPNAPRSVTGQSTRPSLLGTSTMRATLGPNWRGGQATDPRPLKDPAFQHKCSDNILKFLQEYGYDKTLNQKLSSLSSKETYLILEFVYSQLNPKFKFTPKKEDESLLVVLSSLRYPFKITKAILMNCLTPHGWSTMLGIMDWLVHIVRYSKKETSQQSCVTLSGSMTAAIKEVNKASLQVLLSSYPLWMAGNDPACKKIMDECESALAQRKATLEESILQLHNEKQSIEHDLKVREDPVKALDDLEMKIQIESQKLSRHMKAIEDLNTRRTKLLLTVDEARTSVANAENELMTCTKEQQELESQVRMQKYSVADIDRINAEKKSLLASLQSVTVSRNQQQQACWNLNLETTKKFEQLSQLVLHFNVQVRNVNLTPPTAKYARGTDYILVLPRPQPLIASSAIPPSKEEIELFLLFSQNTKRIRKSACELHTALQARTKQVKSEILRYEGIINQHQVAHQTKSVALCSIKDHISRLQTTYKALSEEGTSTSKEKSGLVHASHEETEKRRTVARQGRNKQAQELAEAKARLEDATKCLDKEAAALTIKCNESVQQVLAFKEYVQAQVGRLITTARTAETQLTECCTEMDKQTPTRALNP
ncbi:kinetochore protein NDC80 [Pelomyxa schiedti]|nr:kinetochore protein NDC80 [Pelomyxa schiedti]